MPYVHHYRVRHHLRLCFTLNENERLCSNLFFFFFPTHLIDHPLLLCKKEKPDKSPMKSGISITERRTWRRKVFFFLLLKDRKSSLPFPIEIKDQFNPLSPSKIICYSIYLCTFSFLCKDFQMTNNNCANRTRERKKKP